MPRYSAYSSEYQLFPRIVPVGWSGRLVLDGEYAHTRFQAGVEYSYELQSVHFNAVGARGKAAICGTVSVDAAGHLIIPFEPDVPGEWQLTVDTEALRSRNLPCRLGLYVLDEPWFSLRPYMGELHCHSTGSDGGQEPAYVPLRGRSFGMDFLALTDHRNFHSAVEMKERLRDVTGNRMVLMAGEELHPEPEDIDGEDKPPVHCHRYHYIAVGQRQSVRDACLADSQAAAAAISEIEAELRGGELTAGLDVRGYAEGVWKIRTARKLGATTLFAHPYWGGKPINLDLASIDQSFRDREAHAVEAISRADGSSYMANKLIDLAGQGINWPLVGVSDGHNWNEETALNYCTLVMAQELSEPAILEAVRAGRSVACEVCDPPRFLGPFELVGFSEFYFNSVLPLKLRYTALQAQLGFSYLRGGPFSAELVRALDTELEQLEQDLWAQG